MIDPHIWLEDRNGAEAIAWAQNESSMARKHFESDPRFQQSSKEILEILASTDKIPLVSLFEGFAYNLWQDENHKRGIWRRSSLEEYKKTQPLWEILLDLDALAQQENEPWVFKGATRLPGFDRVLVALSRNNQDASEVREFSLSKKEFIKDGFYLPESKSYFDWYDENHLLVAASFTPDQQTDSGYARKVYLWTRGEDFAQAKLLYEGEKHHVTTWTKVEHLSGQTFAMIGFFINYDHFEIFVVGPDWSLKRMPIPLNSIAVGHFKGHFLIETRGEWKGHPGGSLLSIPKAAIEMSDIPADQIKAVFTPQDNVAYDGIAGTRDRLYLILQENVRGQAYEAHLDEGGNWSLHKVFNSDHAFYFSAADPERDTVIFQEEGYLQARRLLLREGVESMPLKKSKSYFQAEPFVSEQIWVKSADGVEIPYTLIRAKDLKYDGKNPTLLYGYGGFNVPVTPYYNSTMGKQWLEKGGVYVVANIRGGGEFGPEWHKSAMLEKKQKSYDDFIAVAEDLIARKITSPRHLGIQGGSNGGLLVGAVTMQRPDLFNAVVCQIPLLDMIRYTKLPPGASWAGEYGNPEDPKYFDVISKYSPYQNLSQNKKYPKIYFQTTQADDRVHPGHARKMAARMKEFGHEFIFFESTDGGHGGGGVKLEDQARTHAYSFVFLYQQLF